MCVNKLAIPNIKFTFAIVNQTSMQRKVLSLFIFIMHVTIVCAQQVQVCDGVSSLPIRDVLIAVNGKHFGKTDYRGIINLPVAYETATFSKTKYHAETLTQTEVQKDTVFLFPEKQSLGEVVVWGKHTVNGRELLKQMPKRDILEAAPKHDIREFDIGLMLDKRLRRDKEHVKKQREIFQKFDGINTEDPILRAYNETKAEQARQKMEKEIEEKHKNADAKIDK